ncbi:MAG: FAD-binding protein [Thermoleophilia bacterium]
MLARRVGAAIRGTDVTLAVAGGIEQEPLSGRSDWWDGHALLDPQARPPRELQVNARGERFHAEDDPSPARRLRALLEQPDQAAWLVFDEAALQGAPLVPAWSRRDLIERSATGRYAWAAPDVPTLARRAGIDPEGLVRTIETWNVAVRTGDDPLGRRDPWPPIATSPVYAIRTCAVTLATPAGLAVDAELRVLRDDGEPIPGLYAAGEVLGAAATSGDGPCAGMPLTSALTFGRLLGERLALRRFAP